MVNKNMILEITKITEFVKYVCMLILINGMVREMSRDFDTKSVEIYKIPERGILRIDIRNRRKDKK